MIRFHRSAPTALALAVLVATIVWRSFCAAEEVQPEKAVGATTGVKVGVNGVWKNGFQTPVTVEFSDQSLPSGEVQIELETIDTDGAPIAVRRALTAEERERGRAELRFFFPRLTGRLAVRILDGAGEALDSRELAPGKSTGDENFVFPAPQSPARPIYLTIGGDKLGFSEAFAELRLKEELRPYVASLSGLGDLPEDFQALDAVDKIFLSATDPALYDGCDANSPVLKNLERWVERGGCVVLLAGRKSIPLLQPGGAFSIFSPGNSVAERAHEFRAVNVLTSELQNVKNLVMTGSRTSPFLQTPVVSDLKPDARVEMQESETPLLVSRPVGLGSVIFFAADLSEAPISSWSGRGRLMLKILGLDPEATAVKTEAAAQTNRGYVDISGQARSALDSFEGARPVSFAVVAALLLVYLLAIAPWDWFLAKKLVKRPMITWATFPLCVVVFSMIAIGIMKSRTPKEPLVNQADLLDVDMATGYVRDTSWFGFYSPHGARYDFSFAPSLATTQGYALQDVHADVLPLPLSGTGTGGSEQTTYSPRLWDEPYFIESGALRGVPAAARSSRSFSGRWTARLDGFSAQPALVDDGLALTGVVVNPFNVPIYSAYVIFEGGAYALGTLPPGEFRIERGLVRTDPRRALNERRSSVPKTKTTVLDASSYNSASTSLPYILRAASFYDFGGGADNYGLEKRLLRGADLSGLLRSGRAVVYGTVVDSDCDVYPVPEEIERLESETKDADRRGRRTSESFLAVRAKIIEEYGLSGSSPDFRTTEGGVRYSGATAGEPAKQTRRYATVRLIMPLVQEHSGS